MYIRKELYKVKKRFWNKLSVLCYHKVENTCADPVNITVGIRNFQKQIEWLKQSTNIITPKEFENILIDRKEFPEKSVMLTFDDGYTSYHNTMLTLKEHSIPAVFFISTPENIFYWDFLLERLILPKSISNKDFQLFSVIIDSLKLSINIEKSLGADSLEKIKDWKISSHSYPFERCRAFSAIANKLENENPFNNYSIYNKLNKINNSSKNIDSLFSKSNLINYHTIGSHTSNHFNLSKLSPRQQKKEIIVNKVKLEEFLNKKIKFFAYPFGSRLHYNDYSVKLAQNHFKFSFSNFEGNIHKDSNHSELPRFLIRNWDIDEFKIKMKKFTDDKK